VVGDDGTVYYCGLDDSLLAVNPDGVPRWRFGRKHESQTPCLDSNGRIYVMVADGLLCQLEDSVTHPRVRWRRD
jgi:outer membrane protein assembly factor BamB